MRGHVDGWVERRSVRLNEPRRVLGHDHSNCHLRVLSVRSPARDDRDDPVPLLYLPLIAAVAWFLVWHMTANTWILSGRVAHMAIPRICYAGCRRRHVALLHGQADLRQAGESCRPGAAPEERTAGAARARFEKSAGRSRAASSPRVRGLPGQRVSIAECAVPSGSSVAISI